MDKIFARNNRLQIWFDTFQPICQSLRFEPSYISILETLPYEDTGSDSLVVNQFDRSGTGSHNRFCYLRPYGAAPPYSYMLTPKPRHRRCVIPPPGDLRAHLPNHAPADFGQGRPRDDLCYRGSLLNGIASLHGKVKLPQLVTVASRDFPYREVLKGPSGLA